MSKKYLSIVLLIALFSGAIYYSKNLQAPLISFLNSIKTGYLHTLENIQNTIDEHFAQKNTIRQLNKKLQHYDENNLVMIQLASELKDLYKQNDSKLSIQPKVQLVRAVSYEEFGNFNRLWLDVKDYNSSKIYGLTYKNFVAGIVIAKANQPLALLNKDIKSTYSVYIGKDKAPGIVHGNNNQHLVVSFIPAWHKIEIGDEVITSGLDTIFFKGLKVGKVLSISQTQGYQSAVIEPYYKAKEPNYFYLIEETK
jgi:rod shape-determining protein MreC